MTGLALRTSIVLDVFYHGRAVTGSRPRPGEGALRGSREIRG
jgi:hypothetical protein